MAATNIGKTPQYLREENAMKKGLNFIPKQDSSLYLPKNITEDGFKVAPRREPSLPFLLKNLNIFHKFIKRKKIQYENKFSYWKLLAKKKSKVVEYIEKKKPVDFKHKHFYDMFKYKFSKIQFILDNKYAYLKRKKVYNLMFNRKKQNKIKVNLKNEENTNVSLFKPVFFKNNKEIPQVQVEKLISWYSYNFYSYMWLSYFKWTTSVGQLNFKALYYKIKLRVIWRLFRFKKYDYWNNATFADQYKLAMKVATTSGFGQFVGYDVNPSWVTTPPSFGFWNYLQSLNLYERKIMLKRKLLQNYSYYKEDGKEYMWYFLYNKNFYTKIRNNNKRTYTIKKSYGWMYNIYNMHFSNLKNKLRGALRLTPVKRKNFIVDISPSKKQYYSMRNWQFNILKYNLDFLKLNIFNIDSNSNKTKIINENIKENIKNKKSQSKSVDSVDGLDFFLNVDYQYTFVTAEFENWVLDFGNYSIEQLFGHPYIVYFVIYVFIFSFCFTGIYCLKSFYKLFKLMINKFIFYFLSDKIKQKYSIINIKLVNNKFVYPFDTVNLINTYKNHTKVLPWGLTYIKAHKVELFSQLKFLSYLFNFKFKNFKYSSNIIKTVKEIYYNFVQTIGENNIQANENTEKKKEEGYSSYDEFLVNQDIFSKLVRARKILDSYTLIQNFKELQSDKSDIFYKVKQTFKLMLNGVAPRELETHDVTIDAETMRFMDNREWITRHYNHEVLNHVDYIVDYEFIFDERKYEFNKMNKYNLKNNNIKLNYNRLTAINYFLGRNENQNSSESIDFKPYNFQKKKYYYYQLFNNISQTKYEWFFSMIVVIQK